MVFQLMLATHLLLSIPPIIYFFIYKMYGYAKYITKKQLNIGLL